MQVVGLQVVLQCFLVFDGMEWWVYYVVGCGGLVWVVVDVVVEQQVFGQYFVVDWLVFGVGIGDFVQCFVVGNMYQVQWCIQCFGDVDGVVGGFVFDLWWM